MIVIFGGAFNPPTIAHKKIAQRVLAMPDVTKFLFMPVGNHYEKAQLIPATHRVKMLEMVVAQLSNASISKVEIKAKRAFKTIETLEILQTKYPGEDLAFVMGADNLIDLTKWHDYENLIKNFKMIIFNRSEFDVHGFINKNFTNATDNFLIMDDFDEIEISSSQYRGDVTRGELLLSGVEKYIKENALYRN